MPTLLVTKNMSPALAARVAASVSGRRAATPQAGHRRPLTAILRLAALALLVVSVGATLYYRRRSANELSQERQSLLQTVRAQASALTPTDRDVLMRVSAALATHVKAVYDGDFIADDLRSEADLNAALRVPMLYVRGPLQSFSRPGSLADLALNSGKDAFVLCLLDPPSTRSEKALRAKARAATGNGPSMQAVGHVERLGPLFQALPLLAPRWEERVNSAKDTAALRALRKQFEAAPVAAAVRAAKATQLLTVVDEPGTGNGPTELDGERPHGVRVSLIELGTSKLRIRFRREVDPAWISANVRAEYATGIDSCALAMDLRNAITKLGAVVASDKE